MSDTKATEAAVILKLKNYQLRSLFELLDTPLHGEQARSRNRIIKLLRERLSENEKERQVFLQKYAKKDAEQKLVLDASGRNYEMEDQEAFAKEYGDFMAEDCLFDVLPSNRKDFIIVKDIVLECKKPMDIAETDIYESVCAAFELI